jgi:hypothetical protein
MMHAKDSKHISYNINTCMTDPYYYQLNIDVELDMEPIKKVQDQHPDPNMGAYLKLVKECHDKNMLNFLDTVGITFKFVDLAYIPPNSIAGESNTIPIHHDGFPFQNGPDGKKHFCHEQTKISFALTDTPSDLCWYEQTNKDFVNVMDTTPVDTTYIVLNPEDCVKVASARGQGPRLINISLAHGVDNPNPTGQWYISFLLVNKSTNKFIGWKEACSMLEQYIIK